MEKVTFCNSRYDADVCLAPVYLYALTLLHNMSVKKLGTHYVKMATY